MTRTVRRDELVRIEPVMSPLPVRAPVSALAAAAPRANPHGDEFARIVAQAARQNVAKIALTQNLSVPVSHVFTIIEAFNRCRDKLLDHEAAATTAAMPLRVKQVKLNFAALGAAALGAPVLGFLGIALWPVVLPVAAGASLALLCAGMSYGQRAAAFKKAAHTFRHHIDGLKLANFFGARFAGADEPLFTKDSRRRVNVMHDEWRARLPNGWSLSCETRNATCGGVLLTFRDEVAASCHVVSDIQLCYDTRGKLASYDNNSGRKPGGTHALFMDRLVESIVAAPRSHIMEQAAAPATPQSLAELEDDIALAVKNFCPHSVITEPSNRVKSDASVSHGMRDRILQLMESGALSQDVLDASDQRAPSFAPLPPMAVVDNKLDDMFEARRRKRRGHADPLIWLEPSRTIPQLRLTPRAARAAA